MSHTNQAALALINTTVPGHLNPDDEVPVLTGPQAQGDLLVYPCPQDMRVDATNATWEPVTPAGIRLVAGEATGNTHWLHAGTDSPGITWAEHDPDEFDEESDLLIGYLAVPKGQYALILHTDEHGASGVGPGLYGVNGKREQWDEERRVSD